MLADGKKKLEGSLQVVLSAFFCGWGGGVGYDIMEAVVGGNIRLKIEESMRTLPMAGCSS